MKDGDRPPCRRKQNKIGNSSCNIKVVIDILKIQDGSRRHVGLWYLQYIVKAFGKEILKRAHQIGDSGYNRVKEMVN